MFDIDNKSFTKDLEYMIGKLQKHENFAFSKYADGELHILANKPVNNGEFWFVPAEHTPYRKEMIDSFKFRHDNYYVGISCPCCIGGRSVHEWMKNVSEQNASNLTWANIFVNSNYDCYLNKMVPIYSEFDVYLISNSDSNLLNLPFSIKKHFMIGKNAWVENTNLTHEIKSFIDQENVKNSLFLFCAGPFGNILTHQLFEHCENNTYIDIGSTLNPLLLEENGLNRGYLRGESSRKKICIWSS
jgi:hypothetical protein